MLASLSIRDVVLIDRLDLNFEGGLSVLTGETGAGKSILLDSLGLAIGGRAEQRLLRPGAEQASVTAAFELPAGHAARRLLAEQGIDDGEGFLVLRRSLAGDGRSRAFVNDQPVSVGLLRALGDTLIEIQGQFDVRGLLDPGNHRALLDAFAGRQKEAEALARLWDDWKAAEEAWQAAQRDLAAVKEEEDLLRHALSELEALSPREGEIAELDDERQFLKHGEQLLEAMNTAAAEIGGGDELPGAEGSLGAAQRALERIADKAGGRLEGILATLERAAAETGEALADLQALAADLDLDPARLAKVEERYFALRDLARKHQVEPDQLPALQARLAERLAAIDGGSDHLALLERNRAAAREFYMDAAGTLSKARQAAAEALDAAVQAELPPLKLEKARFRTRCDRLEEKDWGPQGWDRVAFEVATNPGSEPGPIGKIASGGELSRFLLALKVVLAGTGSALTLVFDEVDSAVGGATAHAVGERLARLAGDRQVLVVTHSPQVAARGRHHWQVRKEAVQAEEGERVATRVGRLSDEARREELARMLSGAEVTDEARAAADRLLGAA